MKHPTPTSRILLVLLLFVLLPAIFYSAYEINALSTSEELVGEVYRRQLDAVLFSVNQYAYDAASSWANTISSALAAPGDSGSAAVLESFLQNTGSIRAVVLFDAGARTIRLLPGTGTPIPDTVRIGHRLGAERERIDRLMELHASGYRKLEGIPLADEDAPDTLIMLTFVASPRGAARITLAGIVLNPDRFVRAVLAQKISEAAGEEFLLAVFRRGTADPIFATGIGPPARYQQKQLWLFPHVSLGIQLRGATIEDLVRSRFRRNLILILLLDAVLIAGAWLVYRTLRQQIELVRLKSDFVSNVSHELRTPLSLIRMFAETLAMGRVTTEEKKREYYATILQETERLTRLINNILNFSRMEAGRKQYAFTDADVNEIVRQVVATYAPQLQKSGFALSEAYAPELPVVRADREGVAECVINVLDNAIKYSANDRAIAVRTGLAGGSVFVEVEDHGIGIAPEHHGKIFEKFYRVSSPSVHDTKGSGLGLSLVQQIVDAHEGSVTVTSTPGRGSTFRLSFPVSGPRAVPRSAS